MKKGSSQPQKAEPPPSIRWSDDHPAKHNWRDFYTTGVVIKASFFITAKSVQYPLRKENYNVRFHHFHHCTVICRTSVHPPVLRVLSPADVSLQRLRPLGDGTSLRSDVPRASSSPSSSHGPWSDGPRTDVVNSRRRLVL